jgi:23S rRNA maturation mini-RNase III
MKEKVRNQAWIGDAVLSLYVREWLSPDVERTFPDRNELYQLFTSNQFLSSFGEPTAVEAEIGRIYLDRGLAVAFAYIQARFVERFLRTARNLGFRVNAPHPPPARV